MASSVARPSATTALSSPIRLSIASTNPSCAYSRADNKGWSLYGGTVTVGCGDQWPYVPGKQYVDWDLTDPAAKGQDEVRTIRDEIERVGELPL